MKLLVAGDFVPVGRFEKCLYDNSFDFSHISSLTKSADYSLLNFEAPIVEGSIKGIKKNGPNLKVSKSSVLAVKQMGFNAVTLANNHFRDFGQTGVETTIAEMTRNEVEYVGGGANLVEAQRILFKKFEDGIVAIVNICENEFSIATETRGGSMPLDIPNNYEQIIEAKQKADYVVLIVHGGHEGYQLPSPRMKKLYRLFVNLGADAVINHHQHCFSGYEIYRGKPIIYGLGNFIFDWSGKRKSIWNIGYLVSICFDETKIDFELIPYRQCDDKVGAFFLEGDEKLAFEKDVVFLNSIINDDLKLKDSFDKFIKQKKGGVLSTLSPFSNRYLMALVSHGLIPSFICKKKAAMLYNYINCEAHRDITLETLDSLIED